MYTAIIAEGYTLHLEPGVKLRFAPGVMLAINGTLIAKVCMTSSQSFSALILLIG